MNTIAIAFFSFSFLKKKKILCLFSLYDKVTCSIFTYLIIVGRAAKRNRLENILLISFGMDHKICKFDDKQPLREELLVKCLTSGVIVNNHILY